MQVLRLEGPEGLARRERAAARAAAAVETAAAAEAAAAAAEAEAAAAPPEPLVLEEVVERGRRLREAMAADRASIDDLTKVRQRDNDVVRWSSNKLKRLADFWGAIEQCCAWCNPCCVPTSPRARPAIPGTE